ncbi:type III polyketide synthase [Geoalkalibacter halelectricus]|uniref:type III polyketide synthase n=1 Tax=Geoalkalibacter halelectricus TaxID=2847045 RepID=UPI003D21E782
MIKPSENNQNLHSNPGGARIASIATVVPPYSADQAFAAEFMRSHYGARLSARSQGLLRTVFSNPSIHKRHFAVDDPETLVDESADHRIERFTEKSIDLAAQAVTSALAQAGIGPREVKGLVVNTCTGYICPGISTYLLERLGLDRGTRLYDLVGGGCGGALPNLEVAQSLLGAAQDGVVLSVSVEICSAALQMDNDISLIVSNALFGDGASAVVLWRQPRGLKLVASAGRYVPEQREAIRFVHKEGALHNQLSMKLPELVKEAAGEVVAEVLASQGLKPKDVRHWALHTGGEKIINAVRDAIGIPEECLAATRQVLAQYGNMSSPTVWFVLKEIERSGMAVGDWCVMVAYGAGLSAHAYLLRKS